MSTSTTTPTETRALTLLGQGVPPSIVASALGVDPSRISQLLANPEFAAQVVEKKFESLTRQTSRDLEIDSLEDAVVKLLKDALPMMSRPMEIIRAFSIINAAKRRGITTTEAPTAVQTIVALNIPAVLIQQFTKNIHNQVIQVGEKSLLTIQSGTLLKKVEALNDEESTRTLTIANDRQESRTPSNSLATTIAAK